MTTICFDMDGTIADLYGVDNWLNYLIEGDTFPYASAKPMMRFCVLARRLNKLQKNGYRLAIISWLSKSGTAEYNTHVEETKRAWLKKHLPSVHFDEIHIVNYGTPKQMFCSTDEDILFDDEMPNRENWTGRAYDVQNILEILKNL